MTQNKDSRVASTGNRTQILQSVETRKEQSLPPRQKSIQQSMVKGMSGLLGANFDRQNITREETQDGKQTSKFKYFQVDIKQSYQIQCQMVNFSRDESPNPKQYKQLNHTNIQEESGQLGSQYRSKQLLSQSFLKKINMNEYSMENPNSQTMINNNNNTKMIKQSQQSGALMQIQQNEQQKQINQEIARINAEIEKKGFLKIGDIISLSFIEKVHDGDTKHKAAEDQEHVGAQLAKITEKPKMIYKGVVMSDGVTNKSFRVVPRSFTAQENFEGEIKTVYLPMNGSQSFQNCLFKIEIAQDCKYNMIHQELIKKLQELNIDLVDADKETQEQILDRIDECQSLIQANESLLREEKKNNEYEQNMNLGQKISYGLKIQLKHQFSGQYFTLNPKRISQEHGCVALQLKDLCEDSWFCLMPSQKIKFQGQSISYLDSFYIQNFIPDKISKPKFFVHVNTYEIQQEWNAAVLEMNGSYEASKLKARLFMDYNYSQTDNKTFQSGDTFRLYHKEAKGFLSVNEKQVDLMLPSFPDFLQREIKQKSQTGLANENNKNDDDAENAIKQKEDEKKLQKSKIFIEIDPNSLIVTNSYWEIQKVKPFRGGSILWDDVYRIKHIGTGKYLALTSDKLELAMKSEADGLDTLFRFRRDQYHPNMGDVFEELKSGELILLESIFNKFIQIYQDFNDEQLVKFEYNFKSYHQKLAQEGADSQIPTVCGRFAKEDVSKMVFEIQQVPKDLAMIAYLGFSYFNYLINLYAFINLWGVASTDDDNDAVDNFKYDSDEAILQEDQLVQTIEDFEIVINYINDILNMAKAKDRIFYGQVQTQLAEQGLLQMLLKLLELMYYKTVNYVDRDPPFQSAKEKGIKDDRKDLDQDEVEQIAQEYLDPAIRSVLKTVHLLIKGNVRNANIMTKYDDIIFNMMSRHPIQLVAKLFKETYKRATYIHYDTAASYIHADGLDLKVIHDVSQNSNQVNVNQQQKWVKLLETVYFQDEIKQNIEKQILFLKVIGNMCIKDDGSPVYHYQVQAVINVFSNEQDIPLKFSVQKREIDRLFVSFTKKKSENIDIFMVRNPNLRDIYKQNQTGYAKEFEITFDLQEMTLKYETCMPYINYICAVIDLYANMCIGRNADAIKRVREIGISPDLVINVLQNKNIHEKFKASIIKIAKVAFIDCDPFPTLAKSKNRCFFWEGVGKAHPQRTMYGWEKLKYENVHQNKIISNQQESIREAVEKVRQLVMQFFSTGPSDIIEFLYSYATKTYTREDVDPKLKLLLNYMDTSISLIECEHVDSRFIYRMIKTAALIFLSYNIDEMPEEGEKSWIVRFLKVAKKQRGCENKIEQLEIRTLQMLKILCKFRLNSQIMLFLKLFKKMQEENDLPQVFIDQNEHDIKFNIIFQLYQFGTDFNSTSKLLQDVKSLFSKIKDNAQRGTILEIDLINLSDIDDEIKDDPTMKALKKKQQNADAVELTDEQKEELELKKKRKLRNKKYSLYDFLLFMIFKNNLNHQIKDNAAEVLVMNFKQRQTLMQELIKVELIISNQDQQEYQDFKFQTYRLKEHIDQLISDDLKYLFFTNPDNEKKKKCIQDVTNILRGLTQSLKQEPLRLFKKQNMLRHLDVSDELVNRMMKNIWYKHQDHYELFNEISHFLFMFTFDNPNNQRSLWPHLNYLVSLIDRDIPITKLIAKIISAHSNQEESQQFLEFLLFKLSKGNQFKSFLLRLLVLMTYNNPNNKIQIMKRLIKKKHFRSRLYLDSEQFQNKLTILTQYRKKLGQVQSDKALKNDEDWDRICQHLYTVDLIAACASNSVYGIQQARKLMADPEHLFLNINVEAMPFLFKKHYFRFLFEIYINDVEDISNLDLNSQRFYDTLRFIVRDDLKSYPTYYTGLVTKILPDAKRDNENEKNREGKLQSLEKMSKFQLQKMAQSDQNRQMLDNYREEKAKAGTVLRCTKSIPLINDLDFSEYWNYLSRYQKSTNRADGLLHFIRDFYNTIKRSKHRMSTSLITITAEIKEILIKMSDDLHSVLEKGKQNLIDVESIIYHINEAIASIPKLNIPKGGFKHDQGEDNEAQLMTEESQMNELDDSKMLDIRMASDKILKIVRDYIISKNCQIKEAFGIESISNDEYISKFLLKKKLKDIAGTEASFEEIDKAITYFVDFSKEQEQERKIMQVDIGQEGHIHPRIAPDLTSELNFNFRDFEILLKKVLQKAGYKPPHQKRERQVEGEIILFKMEDEELSVACSSDLKLYAKCFFDFCQRYKSTDEIKDIVNKISNIFNKAFEKNQTEAIKELIENMIQGFQKEEQKYYLIKMLRMLLEQYMASNFDEDTEQEVLQIAKRRLTQLQEIMKECQVCQIVLKLITKHEILDNSSEAILLLIALLSGSNSIIQDELLTILKASKQQFLFFEYIKIRLAHSSQKLITDSEQKILIQSQHDDTSQNQVKAPHKQKYSYQQLALVSNNEMVLKNINQQPFYMTAKYDFENELEKLSQQQLSNELLNILRLIQLLCHGCHEGFQNYLRNQEDYNKDREYVTTINILFEALEQTLISLIDLVQGPCTQNQIQLGQWKNFCRALNFFFAQDFGYYNANTMQQKAKLTLFSLTSRLLLSLVDSDNSIFKQQQLQEIFKEIKPFYLKQKMIEVFQFKIGGDQKKINIYMADKVNHNFKCIIEMYSLFEAWSKVKDCDFDLTNDDFYQEFKDQYMPKLKKKSIVSIEAYQQRIKDDNQSAEVNRKQKAEELLQQMVLSEPAQRMFPQKEDPKKKKQEDLLNEGIDQEQTTRIGGYNMDDDGPIEDQIIVRSLTTRYGRKIEGKCKRFCCLRSDPSLGIFTRILHLFVYFTCCTCFRKQNRLRNNQILMINGGDDQNDELLHSTEHSENDKIFRKKTKAGLIKQELDDYKQLKKSLKKQFKFEPVYSFEQFKLDTAIRFYISNVASVEVDFKGKLVGIMFKIPSFCTFMSIKTKDEIAHDTTQTSQMDKLEDIFVKTQLIESEMKSVQRLARRSYLLSLLSTKYQRLSQISYGLIVIINFILLVFYKAKGENSTTLQYSQIESITEILAIIQMFIALLIYLSYQQRYHGVFWQKYQVQQKRVKQIHLTEFQGSCGFAYSHSFTKKSKIGQKNIDEIILSEEQLSQRRMQVPVMRRFKEYLSYVVQSFWIGLKIDLTQRYNYVHLVLSIVGLFYFPIFSVLLLELVIKVPILSSVMGALNKNRSQIINTLLFIAAVTYFYAMISFMYFRESYIDIANRFEDPSLNNYCSTMIECFTSTLSNGLRGSGGIGDSLSQLIKSEPDYWGRWIYDLSFFLIIIVLLLNLILAIIIDAFADIRDDRKQMKSEIKEKCFICGFNKNHFEEHNYSYQDHILREHNLFAYVYFLLYLQTKDPKELSGAEIYVKELFYKKDAKFFPVNRCLAFENN
ncbi:inositol-triphosphate receptor [Stylonychia lemnae]|uniref:Inositol-triphosphate receptor n=1 Tax=Stylonychia lemnae TaxID=5949 RepID=A0A077ZVT6_STYLE|nr:inositol-triphosphate receptor [Stylonychia lemnae]|eukprot:CDW72551.1 inositol-triphosphate receptor [Stylonychia lemnae]